MQRPLTRSQLPRGHRTTTSQASASASTSVHPRPEIRRMSASVVIPPAEQADLPWIHDGMHLIIHGTLDDIQDDSDDEGEGENVNDQDEGENVKNDKVDDSKHENPDDDDDSDSDQNYKTCKYCDDYVKHLHPRNGIPGSFDKAQMCLIHWFHQFPYEDCIGYDQLAASLEVQSNQAKRLHAQLLVATSTLESDRQRIVALEEENARLKASHQQEVLQQDRLRKDLKDQRKRNKLLSDRIAQLEARQVRSHQALLSSRMKLNAALGEHEVTRHQLENTQKDLAHVVSLPPRPIEDDASTSSAVPMLPGPSQNQDYIVLSP